MSQFPGCDRLEDLGREVTVLPLPSMEEVAAAQVSLAGGSRPCAAMAMMFGRPQGRQTGGYRASLIARVPDSAVWTVMPLVGLGAMVVGAVAAQVALRSYVRK